MVVLAGYTPRGRHCSVSPLRIWDRMHFWFPFRRSANLQPPVLTPAIFGIALPPGARIEADGRILGGRPYRTLVRPIA